MLSIDQFEHELLRFTHSRPFVPVADPLDRIVKLIEDNPAFTSSRLLVRLLAALSGKSETFRHAEVGSLDSGTISTVVQLMQARRTGTPAADVWTRAAAKAPGFLDAI